MGLEMWKMSQCSFVRPILAEYRGTEKCASASGLGHGVTACAEYDFLAW